MKNRRELISNPKRLAVAQITLGEKINGKKAYRAPETLNRVKIAGEPTIPIKAYKNI